VSSQASAAVGAVRSRWGVGSLFRMPVEVLYSLAQQFSRQVTCQVTLPTIYSYSVIVTESN